MPDREAPPGPHPHSGHPSYASDQEDETARRSHWRRDQRHGDTGWTAGGGLPESGMGEVDQYGWGGFPKIGEPAHDPDFDPDYLAWRRQQLAAYDRDYAAWRAAQMQRHDDEYRTWRHQGRTDQSGDFAQWRAERAARESRERPKDERQRAEES